MQVNAIFTINEPGNNKGRTVVLSCFVFRWSNIPRRELGGGSEATRKLLSKEPLNRCLARALVGAHS